MRVLVISSAARKRWLSLIACAGLVGAALPVAGLAAQSASADPAPSCATVGTTETCTFAYAASPYSWTVPTGITTVAVTADGGAGADGAGGNNGTGAAGGEYKATLSGLSGQVLGVTTGGAASGDTGGTDGGGNGGTGFGGFIGGGGGGASVVSLGATTLVMAGGGGGGGSCCSAGGAGGTSSATAGGNGGSRGAGQSGGIGGTTVPPVGGAAGNVTYCQSGSAGTPGQGGTGAANCDVSPVQGAGGGGGGGSGYEGGGGGGDYSAGGGGSSYPQSAFTAEGVTVTPLADSNGNTGNGQVVITYTVTATTTALSSAGPDPSTYGQAVTFTATVSPTDGGGSVAFDVNGGPITGCASQPLTQQSGTTYTATCTTSTLPGGANDVTAVYSGDPTYATSPSNAIDQVVHAARTSLRTEGTLRADGDIVVSARLTSDGTPASGQTITFTAGPGITVCTAITNNNGVATCTASPEGGTAIALSQGFFTAADTATADYTASTATGIVDGH